jgi:hypothetical protein
MKPEQRVNAFGKLLESTKTPKQLDDALSSMDASSKFGPLLLQAMDQTGRSRTVKKYQDNFRKTDED